MSFLLFRIPCMRAKCPKVLRMAKDNWFMPTEMSTKGSLRMVSVPEMVSVSLARQELCIRATGGMTNRKGMVCSTPFLMRLLRGASTGTG